MIELTPNVISLVERLFPADEQDKVKRLLEKKFTPDLLHLRGTDETKHRARIEEIQCAAVELSEGQLDRLSSQIRLAHRDWRDVLAALFAKHQREGK